MPFDDGTPAASRAQIEEAATVCKVGPHSIGPQQDGEDYFVLTFRDGAAGTTLASKCLIDFQLKQHVQFATAGSPRSGSSS